MSDIVVVGAGLAGLTAALAIAEADVRSLSSTKGAASAADWRRVESTTRRLITAHSSSPSEVTPFAHSSMTPSRLVWSTRGVMVSASPMATRATSVQPE